MKSDGIERRPLLEDGEGAEEDSDDVLSLKGFLRDGHPAVESAEQDRRDWQRYVGYGWAILSCLCAGSITAFSLYGHLFISHLRYSQLDVNAVSITAELAMYLPVPFLGYACDRYGPGVISFISSILFGSGYLLAALTYHSGPQPAAGGHGWPRAVMIAAFVGVGAGTCSMYLAAVTTCAKNFGRGRHSGLALALPIAAFGLSGMVQSQIGTWLFSERLPDGKGRELNVSSFFLYLSLLLFAVGIVGTFCLKIVDEKASIEEAAEGRERSGPIEDHGLLASPTGYGTLPREQTAATAVSPLSRTQPAPDDAETQDGWRKALVLNAETRRFLTDRTMWWFAAGFFLVIGPGEAFINNLGTIIGTLMSSPYGTSASPTSAATHVSIVAVSSTLARILTGTLSDLLAPSATHSQRLSSSVQSQPAPSTQEQGRRRRRRRRSFRLSRVVLLIFFALVSSTGQAVLASGLVQGHAAERFWAVSALIGTGYGAVFSMTPIIISVIWGVENFGTNWGVIVVVPAFGATLWGSVYSALYQAGAVAATVGQRHGFISPSSLSSAAPFPPDSTYQPRPLALCFGKSCYNYTFWAMAASGWVACVMWLWAWRGPGGWSRRGIVV